MLMRLFTCKFLPSFPSLVSISDRMGTKVVPIVAEISEPIKEVAVSATKKVS